MAPPPEVIELLESRQTGDQLGGITGTRVFNVHTKQNIALKQVGVPKLGDEHPDFPGMTAYDRDSSRQDSSEDWSRVTIRYSSSFFGRLNPRDPNFRSWKISHRNVQQDIPYWIKDPRRFRYRDNLGAEHFEVSYPVRSKIIPEKRVTFIRSVRFSAFPSEAWNKVFAQDQKLHKIYGNWYLFQAGDIQQISRNVWEAQYSWEYDAGTPDVFSFSATLGFPFGIESTISGMYPGKLFCRPPFHSIAVTPQYNAVLNVLLPPLFVPFCNYEADPTGYEDLPGFTL